MKLELSRNTVNYEIATTASSHSGTLIGEFISEP